MASPLEIGDAGLAQNDGVLSATQYDASALFKEAAADVTVFCALSSAFSADVSDVSAAVTAASAAMTSASLAPSSSCC